MSTTSGVPAARLPEVTSVRLPLVEPVVMTTATGWSSLRIQTRCFPLPAPPLSLPCGWAGRPREEREEQAAGGFLFHLHHGRGEAERRAGDQEGVLELPDRDVRGGRHPGPQGEVGVGHLEDRFVGHDARGRGGAVAGLGDLRREGAVRVGGHGEGRLLPLPDLADVGLVHVHVEVHPGQVFGQAEEHRGCEGGGHGLPGLDAAGEDDAVDRRADHRLGEVRFVRLEDGLGLGDRRRGAGGVGLGAGEGRLRRIDLGLRGEPACR